MPEPLTMKDMFRKGIAFSERTGIEATKMEKDGIDLLMPMKGNVNHIGTMYAGALFTLAEMMGGAVAMVYFMEKQLIPIVKELHIKFVKPAKGDITTTWKMSAEEVDRVINDAKEKGKGEYTIELELKDKDGLVVSVTKGFYQVRGSWAKK